MRCSSSERPGDSKAGEASPQHRFDSVAIGRAKVCRSIAPGAAALDACRAVCVHPCRPVGRSAPVACVTTILRPLPHIAVHVVQAEGVWQERPIRSRIGVIGIEAAFSVGSSPLRANQGSRDLTSLFPPIPGALSGAIGSPGIQLPFAGVGFDSNSNRSGIGMSGRMHGLCPQ
jgi:hypothetical protein